MPAVVVAAAAVVARWPFREEVRFEETTVAAPIVSDGETSGGLKAKPGEAPASTAQFVDLGSDPEALPRVEMGPTKVLGVRRDRRSP